MVRLLEVEATLKAVGVCLRHYDTLGWIKISQLIGLRLLYAWEVQEVDKVIAVLAKQFIYLLICKLNLIFVRKFYVC